MKGTHLLPLLLLSTLGCPQQKSPTPARAAEPSPRAAKPEAATPDAPAPEPEDSPTPDAPKPKASKPKGPSLDLLSRVDDKIVDVDPTIGKPTDKSAPDPPPPPRAPPPRGRRAARRPTRKPAAPRLRAKRRLAWVSETISHGQRVDLHHYLRNDSKLRVVEYYADW